MTAEMKKKIRRLMSAEVISGELKGNDEIFRLGHQVVTSPETTMAQKKFAMRRMDEALGTNIPVSEEDVKDYLSHHERGQ